jgi:threonine dehydrogenase-like Zn-dependent dehydrogenase
VRGAVLAAPGRLELVERSLPELAPGEARIRVLECGVCAGDVDAWSGNGIEELPAALGHEVAGVVEEVGAKVTKLAPGDHLVAWVEGGGFADETIVEERFSIPVRPGLAYPAVAEPLACIVNAVELAAPALGDDVVIVGAGYMGNLLQMVSALKGPRSITVADVRPDALARARELGATRVVDTGGESLAAAVGEVAAGDGADITYEVTGIAPGLELAGEVTRIGGKLCIVGYHQGGPRTIPLGHWNWMAFEIVNAHFRDRERIMAGMRAGMRLVDAGLLEPAPLVTHIYPLARIGEAFETAAAKPDGFVKAIVEPAAG